MQPGWVICFLWQGWGEAVVCPAEPPSLVFPGEVPYFTHKLRCAAVFHSPSFLLPRPTLSRFFSGRILLQHCLGGKERKI